MWPDLDQIIGLSVETAERLHRLSEQSRSKQPEAFARLYGFFSARADEDRKKLSYLYHHFPEAHATERRLARDSIETALAQSGESRCWAALFLYHGWGHLMVKRIECRLAGAQPPALPTSAFVYAMF